MKFQKDYETVRDIPIFEGEDGVKALYDVYKEDSICGEFKILALGVSHIIKTCEMWKWDISQFSIRRKSDGEILWQGSDYDSTGDVSVE
jgi:hypothetical protein